VAVAVVAAVVAAAAVVVWKCSKGQQEDQNYPEAFVVGNKER
nr:hypothetical protein [Tanacetum cinerariifolium]